MPRDRTRTADAAAAPEACPLKVVVLDVNETLSDMTPLRRRFEDIGAPGDLLPTWFAGVLRDGFALSAAGSYAHFADVAREGLRTLLPQVEGWSGDTRAAARHVLEGLAGLDVHPDVPAGVRTLRRSGFRLVTMTNGDPRLTAGMLERAGVRDQFDAVLGVGGPRCWKPVPEAYRYAVRRAGVEPEEALLAAVHPWDVDGAQRAGLAGAWLRRGSVHYPEVMSPPVWAAEDLEELARLLTEAGGPSARQ